MIPGNRWGNRRTFGLKVDVSEFAEGQILLARRGSKHRQLSDPSEVLPWPPYYPDLSPVTYLRSRHHTVLRTLRMCCWHLSPPSGVCWSPGHCRSGLFSVAFFFLFFSSFFNCSFWCFFLLSHHNKLAATKVRDLHLYHPKRNRTFEPSYQVSHIWRWTWNEWMNCTSLTWNSSHVVWWEV